MKHPTRLRFPPTTAVAALLAAAAVFAVPNAAEALPAVT